MDTIESPPEEDEEDQIPDTFLNVILSFNQHFQGEQPYSWFCFFTCVKQIVAFVVSRHRSEESDPE